MGHGAKLQKAARERGESEKGRKAELVARLEQAMEADADLAAEEREESAEPDDVVEPAAERPASAAAPALDGLALAHSLDGALLGRVERQLLQAVPRLPRRLGHAARVPHLALGARLVARRVRAPTFAQLGVHEVDLCVDRRDRLAVRLEDPSAAKRVGRAAAVSLRPHAGARRGRASQSRTLPQTRKGRAHHNQRSARQEASLGVHGHRGHKPSLLPRARASTPTHGQMPHLSTVG